jgi:hypothetical protein
VRGRPTFTETTRITTTIVATEPFPNVSPTFLNRRRSLDRDELLAAVYGDDATPDHGPRLSVLLSKLRRLSVAIF